MEDLEYTETEPKSIEELQKYYDLFGENPKPRNREERREQLRKNKKRSKKKWKK